MEDEVRAGFSRKLRNDFTGLLQGIYGNRRFLVRFQDGFEKDIILNRLTVMSVERSPMTEESKVPTISVIPDETVDL